MMSGKFPKNYTSNMLLINTRLINCHYFFVGPITPELLSNFVLERKRGNIFAINMSSQQW